AIRNARGVFRGRRRCACEARRAAGSGASIRARTQRPFGDDRNKRREKLELSTRRLAASWGSASRSARPDRRGRGTRGPRGGGPVCRMRSGVAGAQRRSGLVVLEAVLPPKVTVTVRVSRAFL